MPDPHEGRMSERDEAGADDQVQAGRADGVQRDQRRDRHEVVVGCDERPRTATATMMAAVSQRPRPTREGARAIAALPRGITGAAIPDAEQPPGAHDEQQDHHREDTKELTEAP